MTTDVNLTELWRLVGVVDIALLFGCGCYLFFGYREALPTVLQRVTYVYAAVGAAVAVGLVANWLSPFPPTPGAKIFAVVATVATLYVLGVTWRNATRP